MTTTRSKPDSTTKRITTCTKGRLLDALNAINIGRISHPTWTPVVERHGGRVRMVSSNLSDYATFTLAEPIDSDFTPTPFTPTQVRRLVAGLGQNDLVTLVSVGHGTPQLRVETTAWAATLPQYGVRDYHVPRLRDELAVPSAVFAAMRACAPAASDDLLRPTITPVWTTDGATMATDSYWLLAIEHGWSPPKAANLPIIGVSATIARHAPDLDGSATLAMGAHHVGWSNTDGHQVVAELSPHKPPDWRKLKPTTGSGSIVVSREALTAALGLFFATPPGLNEPHGVRLTVDRKRWVMESLRPYASVPSIDTDIPIDVVGKPPTNVAFGAELLRKLASAFTSEDLVLRFNTPLTPVCVDQDGMLGLLMPVRAA